MLFIKMSYNIPFIPLIMIISFFFFFLISSAPAPASASASAPASSPNIPFIREKCKQLQYRSVEFTSCQTWLLPLAGKFGPRNFPGLVQAAFQLTIDQTALATANISSNGNAGAGGALGDCKENLRDSKEQMEKSLGELKCLGGDPAFHISNIQTWVSGAETDGSTCRDGLNAAGNAAPQASVAAVARAVEVTHITLALFNQFANITNP